MKTLSFRTRAVSALTLCSFTLTTIAPSLAWAADAGDVPERTRVVDEVPSEQLEASRSQQDVKAEVAAKVDTVEKIKPSKEDLQKAAGGKVEGTKAAEAPVTSGDDQTVALPTGGDKSGVTSQSISVPKGSGTIQGMGESFSAQLSTGIATFSVPFSLPAARGGAQPSLGLSYSSGSGAGLAGMGWSVGVPYIARQTDRGLPGYDDRSEWHANQDRFVFNGGQELVPVCRVASENSCVTPKPNETNVLANGEKMPSWGVGYQYFRPRVEGSFLRFFWSPDHRSWRVQDKSGVTMELGVPSDDSADASALEVNPDAKTQIFRWHLVRQYDTYRSSSGKPVNVVVYKYEQDGGQAYLSDIYDTTPAATPSDLKSLGSFAHHTHLEYEPRTDPTETYHSGWLIQQAQRLSRVDVTSKTMTATAERRLVRRYHLDYDAAFHTSYLTSVAVEGRCAGSEDQAPAESNERLGNTNCPQLPPMTFGYDHVKGFATDGTAIASSLAGYEAFDERVQRVGGSPPHSIDEELSDFFDINADGLPDLLVTAPGVYGNSYGVFFNSKDGVRNAFGAVDQMGVAGVLGANAGSIKLSNANVAPLDADGDGIVDFVHMPRVKTYSVYRPRFTSNKWMLEGKTIDVANKLSPKVDLGKDSAETHVLDVNFDGLVDVVVTKGTEVQTYLSLGRLPGGDMQFGNGSWRSSSTATISNDPIATCVPYSGTPVRFSDSDIQLADINGDGIQDIVRVRRGDFRYWPGRGNGFWGTGKLNDCPAGTFGDKRYVTMQDGPYYSDIQGTSLRLDDVNGDGLDDLVQVRTDAVDVWLNIDGRGWTQRHIIDGTPNSPAYANRVRLMDLNGSGTRDITWGDGKKYQYMDLAGGERPGLLTRVENGLGKSTNIDYSSSTEEMLTAERSGKKCSEGVSFERAWCSKMPTVTHVVKRVTESDNLSVAGSGKSQYVTEYSYRDPVYEGRQREFRGFRQARSKRLGDANSPTDFTESTFLLGECEDETSSNGVDDCAVSERWRDNPKEALKGLPVITERFDEQGRYLSTEATNYRLRHLYSGLDGRAVRHAFAEGKRTVLYDTAAPTPQREMSALPGATVKLESEPPASSVPTPDNSWLCELRPDPSTVTPTTVVPLPLRASTGYAVTQSATYVDAFGNALMSIDLGCVAGSACPTAVEGSAVDEAICSYTVPSRRTDEPSGWLFRTTDTWARGSTSNTSAVRKQTHTDYSLEGAPVQVSAVFGGQVALDRFTTLANGQVAPTLLTASRDGSRVVGTTTYDAFGNVIKVEGPQGSTTAQPAIPKLGHCRQVSYADDAYAQFPSSETTFAGGCNQAGVGTGAISTTALYDRGLGLVIQVEDPNFNSTFVDYDGFGRLTQLFKPSLINPGTKPALPSVQIEYSLPSPQAPRAYSIIHTHVQDGENEDDNSYVESYSFVDGMGRARVGLSAADTVEDEHDWIVSSIAEFDAKGAVRRKYLPFFFEGTLGGFPVADSPPGTQYGRQRYDAFGRQIQTFDVDGTVTLQSRYHALSTDLWDAADLYPGPHQGSYASTRTDGHGRTVETTERFHETPLIQLAGNGFYEAYVRTQYLPTGEPTVITRARAGQPSVVRWMRYDLQGRMVLNVDPHTTGNFTTNVNVDATPVATTGLKAWRYAYNDAGDLVGTSDARGCGQNFYYDGAGRLFGEDYSPCLNGTHAAWTNPGFPAASYDTSALTAAQLDKLEVFYQFDSRPSAPVAVPGSSDGYTVGDGDTVDMRENLNGKLVAVHDRAATTHFAYDARGRGIATFRKVSYIGAPQTTIAGRYVNRWYHQHFSYDAADRPIEQTTGVSTAELKSSNPNDPSAVRTAYTKRGTIRHVDSSYGMLAQSIKRSADGLVQSMTLGDAAGTTTAMRYDSRRRLASVQTFRQEANLWSTAPPSISPVPGATDATRQLLLQDLDYTYDIVGNPTEVRDWRTPEEWPDGAKPVSRRMEYDDLYRVTRVDYEYPGGSDKFTSPFANEVNGGPSDTRRGVPPGHAILAKRPLWQTYKYDWLGNTVATDDDQHALYDRSLGNITHYGTADPATSKPYRFKSSEQPALANRPKQSASAPSYDAAGNLTQLVVGRTSSIPCTKPADCNNLQYFYTWDEVGRLTSAGRPTNVGPFLRYLYDANDERVIKDYRELIVPGNASGGTTPPLTTLYVFDSLEIHRAPFDTVTKQYTVDSTTEVAYLSAHGMRLARLHYEPTTKGEPKLETPSAAHATNLHVLFSLPDHLGSSSLTIDQETSELVEARTYQPYGATESDYRPERWKGFREDYGFTGKEEDVEVGLQYFGKRFLSPYLGRWISPDPLAVHAPGQADLNLYAYVSGRVLQNVDPLGLATNGEEAYQNWSQGWADEANNANAEKQKLTDKFRNENNTAYAENKTKFDAGDRNALGAEYRAAADRYDAAMAVVGQFEKVKNWILARVDAQHESVTEQQIDQTAVDLAKGNEVFQTYLAPLILAGIAGTVPNRAQSCFVAGTRIETSRGPVPIEEVTVGDDVLTFDLENGRWEKHRVVDTFVHTDATVQAVFLRSGSGYETVTSTLEHPFWVIDKGWTPAKDLTVGDELLSSAQIRVVVVGGETYKAAADTYNFTVEGQHNYVVGDSQILVHNGCGPQDKPRGDARANVGKPRTEPQLPPKLIAEEGDVSVEHYYRSNDHPPAHAHVKGGGEPTRIGQNGKPIAGDPPLTAKQQAAVDANKSVIRRALNKVGRWLNFHEDGG